MKGEVRVIPARFKVPELPPGYFDRPRLVTRLKAALEGSAILLLAGPGWGKTVLMARLARSCNRRVAWLRLEDEDADAHSFVSSLLTALRLPMPAFGAGLQLRLNHRTNTEIFRATARELESAAGEKGILVCLDDFTRVANSPPVVKGIEYLIERVPSRFTFAIASRIDPAIGHARLMVQRKMAILRERDLAFTREEIDGYLRACGLELSPWSVDRLQGKLDGWPACLALAARRLAASPPVDFKDSLPNKEAIYDYLSQELLDRLPEALRDFLLRTSLLEEVDLATATAIAGGRKALPLLQLVERYHIPLSRSGEPPVWRYHPLFGEFLRHQAFVSLPQEVCREIHEAAAKVLFEKGDFAGAFHHYLTAGQATEAAKMLASQVWQMLHDRRFFALARLIDRLPAGLVDSSPVLCLARGKAYEAQGNYQAASWWYGKAGDRATEGEEVWGLSLAYLGNLRRIQGELDEGARLLGSSLEALPEQEKGWALACLSGVHMLRDRPLQANDVIRDLLALARKTADRALEASGRHVLGVLQFLHLGKPEQGLENLRNSVAMSREAGSESLSLSLGVLSLFELLQGEAGAGETAKAAVSAAQDGGSPRHLGLALEVLGWFLARQGKMEESRRALGRGTELLEDLDDPWFLFPGYVGLACLDELAGNEAAATRSHHMLKELANRIGSALYSSWSLLVETGFKVRRRGIETAAETVGEALKQAELADSPFVLIPAHLRASQLQTSRGLRSLAEEHLLKAAAMAASTGYRSTPGIEPWELSRIIRTASASNIRVRTAITKLGDPWQPPLPPLRICTLGNFEVLRGGIIVSEKEWQRPAVRRLFQFLLIHREHPANREQIAEALWPHLAATTASNNLKAKLALLRQVLEPERVGASVDGRLISVGGCVQLKPNPGDWLDVAEFEGGLKRARLADSLKEKASFLEEALRLHNGPFLSQEPFQDWAGAERERIHLLYQQALADLGYCYEETGETSRALAAWSKIFEEDPFQEEACRELMRCYARLGKSAEVVRCYQRCHGALERELGIGPAQETCDLYRKALAQLSNR